MSVRGPGSPCPSRGLDARVGGVVDSSESVVIALFHRSSPGPLFVLPFTTMDCDKCGQVIHGPHVEAVERRRANTRAESSQWVDGHPVKLHPQCFNPHDFHYRETTLDET